LIRLPRCHVLRKDDGGGKEEGVSGVSKVPEQRRQGLTGVLQG
jgi:hypothetical protein